MPKHESFNTEEMREKVKKLKRHRDLYAENIKTEKVPSQKWFNNKKTRGTPVKCETTGKEFPTIAQAAMAIDCDPFHLSKRIKAGKAVKGFKFIYIG